jgi:hypothetical protein
VDELLKKITSYDLFNHLLPGVVFVFLASKLVQRPIPEMNILIAAFMYYFVGLVISRFGSLVLEPILKMLSFVRFAPYKDFVLASKADEKLELLSEVNNTYRTLCSLFCLLLLLKLYIKIEERFPSLKGWETTILVLAALILFLISYRKQTSYVTKRITANTHAR